MAASTVHLWLALDPEDQVTGRPRVAAQDRPFPAGHAAPAQQRAGQVWEVRELDVPAQTWTKMLRATLTPDQQDRLHLQWWEEAAP